MLLVIGFTVQHEVNLAVEERMKVFVPMSDKLQDINGRLSEKMVPFDPAFLVKAEMPPKGRKPANWIGQSGYRSAREPIRIVEMV